MSATFFSPTTLHTPTRARPPSPARRPVAVAVAAPVAAHIGWLERLALWADAQPQHHRLGSWTLGR